MTDKEIEVIVKPIFTKMFNSNFSACEYGIECYKKGMEYQGIKELATENDNLIKQVRTLEAQIEKMKSQYDYAFNQLCESREIVCLMLSQYKNKKELYHL